jgi:hypothetical protein
VQKELRRHERVLIPETRLFHCQGIGSHLDGLVSVIGLSGMFIRTKESHPAGTTLAVRLHALDADIEVQCIVRDVEPGGLGVEFNRLSADNEQKLKSVLAYLRPAH